MVTNISVLSSQINLVIWESRELFSAECTLTWTFIAWCRWVWLQQRIMVLMTDPSAVSLCGMQSASVLLLVWHTHKHTHTQTQPATLLYASIKATCWTLRRDQLSFKMIYLCCEKTSTRLHFTSESCLQGFTQVLTCIRKTSKQWQAALLIVPECIFGHLNHNTKQNMLK